MVNSEKQQQVEAALQQNPARPNREIARSLAVSEGLVRGIRAKLEQAGSILAVEPDKGGRRPTPKGNKPPLPADEERGQLQRQVLDLINEGRVTAAILVEAMTADQLTAVIQQAPAPRQPRAKPIRGFTGEYAWLSNSWPASVKLDDMEFPSVEIAFQAAKVRHPLVRRVIASARTAEAAKKVVSDVGTRPDWDEVQSKILKDLLQQKFSVPELRQKLVDTWDANLEDTDDSENLLGRLLMKLREVEMVEEWIEWRYYGGNDRKSDDNAAEQGQATPDNGGDIELTLE